LDWFGRFGYQIPFGVSIADYILDISLGEAGYSSSGASGSTAIQELYTAFESQYGGAAGAGNKALQTHGFNNNNNGTVSSGAVNSNGSGLVPGGRQQGQQGQRVLPLSTIASVGDMQAQDLQQGPVSSFADAQQQQQQPKQQSGLPVSAGGGQQQQQHHQQPQQQLQEKKGGKAGKDRAPYWEQVRVLLQRTARVRRFEQVRVLLQRMARVGWLVGCACVAL
jgi:hypothetical protein